MAIDRKFGADDFSGEAPKLPEYDALKVTLKEYQQVAQRMFDAWKNLIDKNTPPNEQDKVLLRVFAHGVPEFKIPLTARLDVQESNFDRDGIAEVTEQLFSVLRQVNRAITKLGELEAEHEASNGKMSPDFTPDNLIGEAKLSVKHLGGKLDLVRQQAIEFTRESK